MMLCGKRCLEASIALAEDYMLEIRTSSLVLECGKQFKRVVRFSIKAYGGFWGEIVI